MIRFLDGFFSISDVNFCPHLVRIWFGEFFSVFACSNANEFPCSTFVLSRRGFELFWKSSKFTSHEELLLATRISIYWAFHGLPPNSELS